MFYHFPSRLVTSYKLDHLIHLPCTWNSNWNSAILTVQRKITFQSPTYIFFWFILLIFYLDQNSNSLGFLQAHIWVTSIIVLGNDFSFWLTVCSIYNLVNTVIDHDMDSLWPVRRISKMLCLYLSWPAALSCNVQENVCVCLCSVSEFCVCWGNAGLACFSEVGESLWLICWYEWMSEPVWGRYL